MLEKRPLKPTDLAFAAAKKRQSPRTGFIHLFHGSDGGTDTIPFYENGCFALALLAQKKTETVSEAKDLWLRLLGFQTEKGNFPLYLHDFPRCYDLVLGLKVAPLLLLTIKNYSSILGPEVKEAIHTALHRIFAFYEERRRERPLPPLWEYRYLACRAAFSGQAFPETLDSAHFSALEIWEYWISRQFFETPLCDFYHPELTLPIGPFSLKRTWEGFEPKPERIDWMAATQSETMPERLLRDHPEQIHLAALEHLEVRPLAQEKHTLLVSEAGALHLLWNENRIHSLVLETEKGKVSIAPDKSFLEIALPEEIEFTRNDLFEVSFFCDASPEIDFFIEAEKGTVFTLGQTVTIGSPHFEISLLFELIEGEGDFCGHVFRSNRSTQIGVKDHESYDWKIGIRTLRRSKQAKLRIQLQKSAISTIR